MLFAAPVVVTAAPVVVQAVKHVSTVNVKIPFVYRRVQRKIMFGQMYGMGDAKLMELVKNHWMLRKLSVDDAQKVLDDFYRSHPGVKGE